MGFVNAGKRIRKYRVFVPCTFHTCSIPKTSFNKHSGAVVVSVCLADVKHIEGHFFSRCSCCAQGAIHTLWNKSAFQRDPPFWDTAI